MRRRIFGLFLILFTLAQGVYLSIRYSIKRDIDLISKQAINQYNSPKVQALILLLDADSNNLAKKNKAIWALGKSRDKRALPVLYSLKTNSKCDHQLFVCQRELHKAISNLEGTGIDLFTYK